MEMLHNGQLKILGWRLGGVLGVSVYTADEDALL